MQICTETERIELADAKIVTRKNVERGITGYFAREVFDLLTIAE